MVVLAPSLILGLQKCSQTDYVAAPIVQRGNFTSCQIPLLIDLPSGSHSIVAIESSIQPSPGIPCSGTGTYRHP